MKVFTSKWSKRLILGLALCVPVTGILGYGDDLRIAFNNVAERNVPLENRDLISFRETNGDHAALISAEYISKTGDISRHAWFSLVNLKVGNMTINWKADDAFTRAFRGMEDKIAGQIQASPALMTLKGKAGWTMADYQAWDEGVANIVAGIADHTPGLDQYRTDTDGKFPQLRDFNKLGNDIANGTHTQAYDCKQMSVVKGVLQERMAERFLSPAQRSRYFVVFGENEFSRFDEKPGDHTYVVAEKNNRVMGVIEGTEDQDVYHPLAKPYNFSDFAAGQALVTKAGGVYGFAFTHAEADQMRGALGFKSYDQIIQESRQKQAERQALTRQQKLAAGKTNSPAR
jgi:hypothetical protein